MAKIEQTAERQTWLRALQKGDIVRLETLLGIHRARVTKVDEKRECLTVKLENEPDPDIQGYELNIFRDTGIGFWPHNSIHPPILEHIGDPQPDSPIPGWEAS